MKLGRPSAVRPPASGPAAAAWPAAASSEQEATPMKPGILEQLDKLIEENKQTRSQIYFRGDKGSREYIRCEGQISGLQLARKAVADWIEENREEG
jgi:hypothetical protein